MPGPARSLQLRQRVGEPGDGGTKSSMDEAEADSGYQDAQDALEEMIEEVRTVGWSLG